LDFKVNKMATDLLVMTITLLGSQYLVCRFCKVVFLFLNQIYMVLLGITIIKLNGFEMTRKEQVLHLLPVIILGEASYFCLFNFFEEGHIEGLRNMLTFLRLQEETRSILENVDSGIIAKTDNKEVKYINKLALKFMKVPHNEKY